MMVVSGAEEIAEQKEVQGYEMLRLEGKWGHYITLSMQLQNKNYILVMLSWQECIE